MPRIPAPEDQWFVVQVLSGQENKVYDNMMRRIESEEMSDYIFSVLVPKEKVSEVKRGEKKESSRKFFPGYVIVNMHLLSDGNELVGETWYFIQETPGVINFAGGKSHPMPMKKAEVDSLLAQIKQGEEGTNYAVQFEVGDSVKVADGPFESQTGVVEEIDLEKGKLRVTVNIFGRPTPVDLEFWQVEAA
ncbi:MAG: transcription termination/antitermination protein NusG [Verrucomicrobiota bacterium]